MRSPVLDSRSNAGAFLPAVSGVAFLFGEAIGRAYTRDRRRTVHCADAATASVQGVDRRTPRDRALRVSLERARMGRADANAPERRGPPRRAIGRDGKARARAVHVETNRRIA